MRLGFSPITAGMIDLTAAFALAESLGLDFIELSADLHEIAAFVQDVTLVKELRAATGVGVTVHLSYVDLNLASLIPAARRTSVDRTLRGLEYAHQVGAHCGVLHSGLHYVHHPQAEALVEQAVASSLGELAGSTVPIALENLALDHRDYVRGPQQLHELTRAHGLRNCFDFGHAHVEGTRERRELIAAYQQTLAGDIIHLHVHNNHGAADEHLPTDDGTIDYVTHAPYLASFAGTICLEILAGEAGVRSSVEHLRSLQGVAT